MHLTVFTAATERLMRWHLRCTAQDSKQLHITLSHCTPHVPQCTCDVVRLSFLGLTSWFGCLPNAQGDTHGCELPSWHEKSEVSHRSPRESSHCQWGCLWASRVCLESVRIFASSAKVSAWLCSLGRVKGEMRSARRVPRGILCASDEDA